jgi:hypothetical protein
MNNVMGKKVVLLCPCCASPVDAEASIWEQKFLCQVCGQDWIMAVDADRVAEYALT